MMSAIGDYIHQTLKGYVDGHKGERMSKDIFNHTLYPQALASIRKVHTDLNNRINIFNRREAFAQQLENDMNWAHNFFLGVEEFAIPTKNQQALQIILNAFIKDINTTELGYTATAGGKVYRDTKKKLSESGEKLRTAKIELENRKYGWKISTFLTTLTSLRRAVRGNNSSSSQALRAEILALQKNVINYCKELKQREANGETILRNQKNIIPKWDYTSKMYNDTLVTSLDYSKGYYYAEQINGLLSQIFKNHAIGLTAELSEAFVQSYYDYLTKEDSSDSASMSIGQIELLNDIIENPSAYRKKPTAGSQRHDRIFDIEGKFVTGTRLYKKKKDKEQLETINYNNGTVGVKYANTQGKSDASIEFWFDGNGGGTSIKSYNLTITGDDKYDYISLVSGSPMLYLIQSEDADFINHWINLTIEHPTGEEVPSASRDINKNVITVAHREMKRLLVFNAATGFGAITSGGANNRGYMTFQDAPDLFLVIDNSVTTPREKWAYVIPMGRLINAIVQDVDGYINWDSYKALENKEPWNTPITFNEYGSYDKEGNRRQAGPIQRINFIINQLFRTTINIKFHKKIFKQFGHS